MYLIVGLIPFMNIINDLTLKWKPRKMKKIWSMKLFPKKIRLRKVRMMVHSPMPMYRSAQREAILVPMELPYIWCICVSMKLKVLCGIWGGGLFVGSSRLYYSMTWITTATLSLCAMFVYKYVTSAVTRIALVWRGGSFSIRLRKYFVPLMCDGKLLGRGCIKWVR